MFLNFFIFKKSIKKQGKDLYFIKDLKKLQCSWLFNKKLMGIKNGTSIFFWIFHFIMEYSWNPFFFYEIFHSSNFFLNSCLMLRNYWVTPLFLWPYKESSNFEGILKERMGKIEKEINEGKTQFGGYERDMLSVFRNVNSKIQNSFFDFGQRIRDLYNRKFFYLYENSAA